MNRNQTLTATNLGPDPARCDRFRVAAILRTRGQDDLADLYEHCATFYPSHSIPASDCGVRNLVPESAVGMSSPAALCFEN